MSGLLTLDIWGIHAVAELCPKLMSRRDETALRVNSYRCGGSYELTRVIASKANELNNQEKALLTSWLFEQRQAGNSCPEITAGVIDEVKKRKNMSISDRTDAILLYIKSKISEFNRVFVYDNLLKMTSSGMGEEQIYQFILRENIIYFELLVCSECADKHDLAFLMEYLEQKRLIMRINDKRLNELYAYILTSKGYDRIENIETRNNYTYRTNQTQNKICVNETDDKFVKTFISYSWDNEDHKQWVKDLAQKLRSDGIEAILDEWELALGDQLTHFMEKKIQECEYVLIICTPDYCKKSNDRQGGVGYEDHVMTASIYQKENNRKFIPILAKGSWRDAAPSWLIGKVYVNLSTSESYKKEYSKLKATLLGERPAAPAVRRRSPNE